MKAKGKRKSGTKKKPYRMFTVKKGVKGKKFRRYLAGLDSTQSVVWNKEAVASFKVSNSDRYYIRAVHRYSDKYEIYLRERNKK